MLFDKFIALTLIWAATQISGAAARALVLSSDGLDLEAPHVADCCKAVNGYCRDMTKGTPCCGKGKCNIFCCNCDGGCRKHRCDSKYVSQELLDWPMSLSEPIGNFSVVDLNDDGDISISEWRAYVEKTISGDEPELRSLMLEYYYQFAHVGANGEYHLGRAAAHTPSGSKSVMLSDDPHAAECCPQDNFGYCGDCTKGTPCCAYGKCNIFCCNCDGGCRPYKNKYELPKGTADGSGDCAATKFAAVDIDGDGVITEYEWSMHASNEIVSAGIAYHTTRFSQLHKDWMDQFYRFAIMVNGEYILTITEARKRG